MARVEIHKEVPKELKNWRVESLLPEGYLSLWWWKYARRLSLHLETARWFPPSSAWSGSHWNLRADDGSHRTSETGRVLWWRIENSAHLRALSGYMKYWNKLVKTLPITSPKQAYVREIAKENNIHFRVVIVRILVDKHFVWKGLKRRWNNISSMICPATLIVSLPSHGF